MDSELARIRKDERYSIYHSNFRFLLRKRGIARPKIEMTLDKSSERKNFWRYNNGITVACESVAKEPLALNIKGFQVVNGLQTIEALFENSSRKHRLDDVRLLVRVIPTHEGQPASPRKALELEEHIAEYSNSQTPLRARDLRSNDLVQQTIAIRMLRAYGLRYVRKEGEDPQTKGLSLRNLVNNEEAAQASLSFWFRRNRDAKGRKAFLFNQAVSPFYDMVFDKRKTTADFVLLPYLVWESQYNTLFNSIGRRVVGNYKSLDLLAVAVFGDAYRKAFRIPASPTKDPRVQKLLKKHTKKLLQPQVGKFRKLWRSVFVDLLQEARKQWKQEIAQSGRKDLPLRNIMVKMDYDDITLRRKL